MLVNALQRCHDVCEASCIFVSNPGTSIIQSLRCGLYKTLAEMVLEIVECNYVEVVTFRELPQTTHKSLLCLLHWRAIHGATAIENKDNTSPKVALNHSSFGWCNKQRKSTPGNLLGSKKERDCMCDQRERDKMRMRRL